MRYRSSALVLGVLLLVGCGGGGGGDGGTNPAPVFTTFEVTPATTTLEVGASQQLVFSAKDQNGGNMTGTLTLTSSDNTKATVNGAGLVSAVAQGTATITASMRVGNVTKTDATVVTVIPVGTFPLTATVTMPGNSFSPDITHIARTGVVTFTNGTNTQHNVTFAPKAGAPSDMSSCQNCSADKQFNTVDTYSFQCTLHAGMNGTIVVH